VEQLKDADELLAPDKRRLGLLDPDTGESQPVTIEQHHSTISNISLRECIPEDVRDHFDSARMVYVYGWLYYPLFAVAQFLATVTLEFALRKRLPFEGKNRRDDRRGLASLLKTAFSQGIVKQEKFANWQDIVAEQTRWANIRTEITGAEHRFDRAAHRKFLIGYLPLLRNNYAHPHIHTIVMPSDAQDTIVVVAEILNQLWTEKPPRRGGQNPSHG
jgi:hypothetical protein